MYSESEGEDDATSQISLDQKIVKKKGGGQKSSVRLIELGPRITMKVSISHLLFFICYFSLINFYR